MPPGAAEGRNIEIRGAILGPPGAGFFNYVSPGGWTCQVMHSGSNIYVYIELKMMLTLAVPAAAIKHGGKAGCLNE